MADYDTDTYRDVAYITSSKYRIQTLDVLADGPATPTGIVDDSGFHIAKVSNALSDLRERDLVELLVPEETKKGRIYGVTDEGERILEAASEVSW